MALCRCISHPPQKRLNGKVYVSHVNPSGGEQTSSICGRNNCSLNGKIWLTVQEKIEYEHGTRIFSYATNSAKVAVV